MNRLPHRKNNAGSPAEIAPKIGGCAAICQAFNGPRNLLGNACGGHAVSQLPKSPFPNGGERWLSYGIITDSFGCLQVNRDQF